MVLAINGELLKEVYLLGDSPYDYTKGTDKWLEGDDEEDEENEKDEQESDDEEDEEQEDVDDDSDSTDDGGSEY